MGRVSSETLHSAQVLAVISPKAQTIIEHPDAVPLVVTPAELLMALDHWSSTPGRRRAGVSWLPQHCWRSALENTVRIRQCSEGFRCAWSRSHQSACRRLFGLESAWELFHRCLQLQCMSVRFCMVCFCQDIKTSARGRTAVQLNAPPHKSSWFLS